MAKFKATYNGTARYGDPIGLVDGDGNEHNIIPGTEGWVDTMDEWGGNYVPFYVQLSNGQVGAMMADKRDIERQGLLNEPPKVLQDKPPSIGGNPEAS